MSEIDEICMLSEPLLEALKKNKLLLASIQVIDQCKVGKLLRNSLSYSQNKTLDIRDLHELYMMHIKFGITSIHFLEFIKCLKEAYGTISSKNITSNEILKNMMHTLEKFIEYENEPSILLIEKIKDGIENDQDKTKMFEILETLKEIVENYQMKN